MIIKLENICKKYNENYILQNVNFEITHPQTVAIIGSSGSGKTTFLQIASLLDEQTSGSVQYFDQKTDGKMLEFRKKYTSFVYQFHNLMPEFTAEENIRIAGAIKNSKNDDLPAIMHELGLSGKENRKPAELSGGECQRVSIARAVFSNPAIIFADEPTGNLDPENAIKTINLMLEVVKNREIAMIIVTHNYEIARMCDTTYEIKNANLTQKVW